MDVCFAGIPPRAAEKSNGKGKEPERAEEGPWIALVSGMELGGNEDADDLRADLLAEYLTGELGADSVSSLLHIRTLS